MTRDAGTDPRPRAPREPAPEECCGRGCDLCVYDRYYETLERYREALRLWRSLHPEEGDDPPSAGPPDGT